MNCPRFKVLLPAKIDEVHSLAGNFLRPANDPPCMDRLHNFATHFINPGPALYLSRLFPSSTSVVFFLRIIINPADHQRLYQPRQPKNLSRSTRLLLTLDSLDPDQSRTILPNSRTLPRWQYAMAPMKTLNSNYSSSNGEDVAREANVLASCYVVDIAGSLKGLHYCTTLAAGKDDTSDSVNACKDNH